MKKISSCNYSPDSGDRAGDEHRCLGEDGADWSVKARLSQLRKKVKIGEYVMKNTISRNIYKQVK